MTGIRVEADPIIKLTTCNSKSSRGHGFSCRMRVMRAEQPAPVTRYWMPPTRHQRALGLSYGSPQPDANATRATRYFGRAVIMNPVRLILFLVFVLITVATD